MKLLKKLFFSIAGLLLCFSAFSQPGGTRHTTWSADPFDYKVFIENKGQLTDVGVKEKIFYVANLGAIKAYFTANSVIYQYDEYPQKSREAKERYEREGNVKPVAHFCSQVWQQVNPTVTIDAQLEESYYYSYGTMAEPIKARAYKKITYHNLYPGIDAEYFFPKDKQGIKYNLIVHPGADISKIKYCYQGGRDPVFNAQGDMLIASAVGEFTEHAPESFYTDGEKLRSSFVWDGNYVSFKMENPDLKKTIVIDPWVTNPNIPGGWNANLAYDVDYDDFGNVYAFGSYYPFILVKFNSAGAILWKYTVPSPPAFSQSYGDFAVDRSTGTSYLVCGASAGGFNMGSQVLKVSTGGALQAQHAGVANGLYEMWRAAFDPCLKQLVIAGGGVYNTTQALVMDVNLNIVVNPANILGATLSGGGTSFHDLCLLALDPAGGTAYMGSTKSNVNAGLDDLLCKVPLPTLTPTAYKTPLGFPYVLREGYFNGYVLGTVSIGNPNSFSNAINGMAASSNWVYVCDGTTLTKYNKASGASVASATTYTWTFPGSKDSVRWSGTDVDLCDNIYVGVKNSIKVYNSSLALTQTIAAADTVYDVKVGLGNMLYACGKGFVSAITITGSNTQVTHSSTPASSCGTCDASATATLTVCGGPAASATYSWSSTPAQTTQTATNLCPGNYTVTITLDCSTVFTDTVNILAPSGAVNATITSVANILCNGVNNGTASVNGSGGTAPYTYNWSGGATTSAVSNLSAGSYTCTITDAGGCQDTVLITISQPPFLTSTLSATPDQCNSGNGTVSATANGGTPQYSYAWSPAGSTNASATGLTAGNYTMTITDSNGCTKTDTVTVPGSGILSATAGPASTICNGQTASLSASGGGSYSWSTGATSASISVAPSSNASYSVVVFAGSCIDTAFVTVAVLPVPVAAVSGATICAGDVATITASGGTTYSWNNGNTNSSIIILPTASVTYSVIVSNGNCSDSASATVTVNPSPTVSVSGNVLLCMGDIATLTASGATTYLWSNGNTNSMINVSPSATTTYSVLASSGACTNTASVTVVVSPPPVALVSDVTICAGNIATLTAFGGTIYSWSTGATTSSITVSPASATTYSVVVSITTCSDSASASVIVNPVPMALAWNNIIITAGTSTTLSASGGGTYIWSNGFIDSTITVSPPVTTMYCVTVSNGNCTDTACVIVSVEPTDCSPFSSEDAFVLPSAFSPNSDGQNDTWKLLYAPALANCIAEFEVLVYSRWGEKVFEGTDINFSWDGKYKNKIEDTAVFGYYLTGILKDGTKIKKSGNVSLLR